MHSKPSGIIARALDDGEKRKNPEASLRFGRTLGKISDPFTPILGFNRSTAAFLGLRFARSAAIRFDVSLPAPTYRNPRLATGGCRLPMDFPRSGLGGLDYHDGTLPRASSQVYPALMTDALTFAGRDDYHDYYRSCTGRPIMNTRPDSRTQPSHSAMLPSGTLRWTRPPISRYHRNASKRRIRPFQKEDSAHCFFREYVTVTAFRSGLGRCGGPRSI